MTNALDVARYFVEMSLQGSEPEGVTLARLQALLYYAQGWHLGAFRRPLFPEKVVARKLGPMVRELAETIGGTSVDPLRPVQATDLGPSGLPFRDRQFIEAIWEKYRGYSAVGLREMAQSEQPWVEARAGRSDDDGWELEIAQETLRRYFGQRDEIRNFDPQEWEDVTEGEAQYARGETISWSEAKRLLRERRLSTHPNAVGP
jgi:uncharacterized phage-associated protein